MVVVEKVKSADLVRAVVGAVARADTAIVRHDIKAFIVMDGGVNGADCFAWGVFALHTGDGLRDRFRFIGFARVVAIYANPVHFTTFDHLVFSDDWNIVFGGASGDASVATRAGS